MIRPAKYEDLPAINEIYNQAVDSRSATADLDYISFDERDKWFSEHNSDKYPVFVYEVSGNVVGWLSISPYRKGRRALDEAAEVSYYIHNNFQKLGIGSKLLEYCIENISSYGIKHIICILLDINTGSIKLLEKYGFEQWAYLPDIVNLDGNICSHLFYGLTTDIANHKL
ncbi:MAG: N-acetyltransferase [Candidatus Kapabacteria bacterium]|nr:N-acetyltransferase [Ignavibacteriota bacterium]MCW5884372.1 N-acetyltransferase [Candidatus Kapabacteria bacterium]